jgi:hypothetical protein
MEDVKLREKLLNSRYQLGMRWDAGGYGLGAG